MICPTHGTTLFRSCPSCQAEKHPAKTQAEAREAQREIMRRAGAIRAKARREAREAFWGAP